MYKYCVWGRNKNIKNDTFGEILRKRGNIVMVCKFCGAQLPVGASVCPNCGKAQVENRKKISVPILLLCIVMTLATFGSSGYMLYCFGDSLSKIVECADGLKDSSDSIIDDLDDDISKDIDDYDMSENESESESQSESESESESESQSESNLASSYTYELTYVPNKQLSGELKDKLALVRGDYKKVNWSFAYELKGHKNIIVSVAPIVEYKYKGLAIAITNLNSKPVSLDLKGEYLDENDSTIGDIRIFESVVAKNSTVVNIIHNSDETIVPTGKIHWNRYSKVKDVTRYSPGAYVASYSYDPKESGSIDLKINFSNTSGKELMVPNITLFGLDKDGNIIYSTETSITKLKKGEKKAIERPTLLDVEEAMELTKSAFFCSAYTKNK